jgi:HEXXH motif-containing protein
LITTTHSLAADTLTALAGGADDGDVVRQLREAQLSKHLMLLGVVAEAAGEVGPPSPAASAFRTAYQLLGRAQAADPSVVAGLLGLPHIGSWGHDCLTCLDTGLPPDFGYLAPVAAAAAVRLGIPFDLDVQVRDGRVPLPGLGCLEVADHGGWIRLSSDGERLRAGGHTDVPCPLLVPDDGSGRTVPHWRGTPLVRVVADGRAWEVLLETADRHLDRYSLPVHTVMAAAEVTRWRQLLQAAWELLVRHHEWAAGPIAEGVRVIVPLEPQSDLDSETSPAAFGAIATSCPPHPVSMAETLVHEFQHTKLCGLMDMLPLTVPCAERGYAPWREDPRPLSGILHGVYAFTGIVRFWDVQRRLETEPDGILRASVLYERWRLATEFVTRTLLDREFLTPVGVCFVTALREREKGRESAPVPAEAAEIAREVALDNWLTWQLTHTALDAAEVATLADAFRRGKPLGGQAVPEARVESNARKVDSVLRSRLLKMRYLEPRRYGKLTATGIPGIGAADGLLIRGDTGAAITAYREALAARPDPVAWIGLALAIHRPPAGPVRPVFVSQLPLLFEVHSCLARQGIHADPLELAAWFA